MPLHPGGILLGDFLKPMGITQHRLAKSLGYPSGILVKSSPASVP